MIVYKLPNKLFLLFLIISPAAYAIGGNSDNTWYSVHVYPDSLFAGDTVQPTHTFATRAEAEAAMRAAVPYGDKLIVENKSGHNTYYYVAKEEVIPGDAWKYPGRYGGGPFDSAQGAIDEFFSVNQYDCKVEDGPLGGWSEGSVWYCYPPGQPRKVEIATYNLRVLRSCSNENSYIDVDPVFCRWRKDSCPEHAPHFTSDPVNGNYCNNSTRAVISEFTCKCNETSITGGCESVATENLITFDSMGAAHFYQEAVDPQYRPLKCQEHVEIPQGIQCAVEGNPVNIATGCKFQDEVDYRGGEGMGLVVKRHYKASSINAGLDAPKKYVENLYGSDALLCHTNAPPEDTTEASSKIRDSNGGWYIYKTRYCPIMVLLKPSGEKVLFSEMSEPPDTTGTWYEASNPKGGRVKRSGYYYYYYDHSGATYTFYYDHKLTSIEKDGKVTRFSYRYNNLEKVTDPYGRELFYTYNDANQITSVRVPGNQLIKYGYDSNGNLTEVIYPDDSSGDDTDNPRKQYLYEDSRFPKALTGIINENGVRYASWEYDEYGRAISSAHNGGIDKYEFEYIDGNTTLVRKYLSDTDYHETTKTHHRYKGVDVITSISNSPCTGCTVGDIARQYDPDTGDLLSKTDERGITTTYEYDDAHRQTLRIEAAGTPQERVIETVWDTTINKPLQVIETNRITEFTYDANGHLSSKTERALP